MCDSHEHHHHNRLGALLRIVCTAAGLVLIPLWMKEGLLRFAAYGALYLLIGGDVVKKAAVGLLKGRLLNETFLMTVATLGAFVLALLTKSGDYFEAVAVMLFYQVGEMFEHWAAEKSRKNIGSLMDIRPDCAHLEEDTGVRDVHPGQVMPGAVIRVYPGEKVPLDGVVEAGESSVNTMALTGESMPRDVQPGDTVLSGSVNLQGALRIRTTKTFGASTVSKILELVEHAAENKAPAERLISRFARMYTPVVCGLALALAVVPPVVTGCISGSFPFLLWLERALVFLVISCPCALVIGVPLAFFAGMGGAGKAGVLVKGSHALEKMARIGYVLMDKTGTLTQGQFSVSHVESASLPAEELLETAALAESATFHPIGRCLMKVCGKEDAPGWVSDVREWAGRGVEAAVDGKRVLVGNERLMEENGIDWKKPSAEGTVVHVAAEGVYAGHIILNDLVKPGAEAALLDMKKLGVREIHLLTGDRLQAAQEAARGLPVEEVHASLLPQQKVEILQEVQRRKEKQELVMFVGDGINDAPVLSCADIGVAMGGAGSDAAMEAADAVLMDEDLAKLPRAMGIAKKTVGIVKQNIAFSLGVKFICLLMGALGYLNMSAAVFADVGVMVLAVLNAVRALKGR